MRFWKLLPFTAMLLLAACAKEPAFEEEVASSEGLIPLNIDGSISQVATKATAGGFVDKDAVGLYAVNYTSDNTVAGTLAASGNQADNVKYVFDESAHKWTPVKAVYYKDINTNVDLYLYYPYQNGITDVTASNFEVKKDQSSAATETELSGYEASDWLWGKAANITPSESRVAIQLGHKLSSIKVNLVEGSGFAVDEFDALEKSVIVTNTTRKAHLNFTNGAVTPVGAAQSDGIVMCPQTDGSFRAIVIPQTVAASTKLFAITIDGVSYGFTQAEAVTYQAGKQLVVNININKKTPSGTYELTLASSEIVDWTEDLNTHGGEARQYYVVNVETPGTLGDVIAAGKNPAKIKNLKVTGQVNHEDFYFMRDQMTILEAVNMKEAKVKNALMPAHYEYNYETNESIFFPNEYMDDIIPANSFVDKSSLYYFVFPEKITNVGASAFDGTNHSGALIIPEDVTEIGDYAFRETNISSIQFPNKLELIGSYAFDGCRATSGVLQLPSPLIVIGSNTFKECGFNSLHLPENLERIGDFAFYAWSSLVSGDLHIPESVNSIGQFAFTHTRFTGRLLISSNNLEEIGIYVFNNCLFSGELSIPNGVKKIGYGVFGGNNFSSVVFPSSLRTIGQSSFVGNPRLCEPLIFPEGFLTIGAKSFEGCSNIPSIYLPSTIQTIGSSALNGCYNVSSITCDAVEPPTVQSGAFDGVAKDNCTVEVPPQSVMRYQAESGWSDFNRIAGHYDFSLSRRTMRALNAAQSRTYILRAPANFDWSIDSKPDWITVSPSSGTGKTDVTITVNEMARTNDTFEVNEGTFLRPTYKNYKGRKGDVVFKLDAKDYTFTFTVEQYDSDYSDGQVQTLHTATQGPGIDFVLTGDGYDAKDISKGTFTTNATDGYNHLFAIEPYKTYKDYFNVYYVVAQSDDSGIGTVNTVKDSKFGARFTQSRIMCENPDAAFTWAKKANASMDFTKSLVILLMNTSTYEGICYMYTDGSAIACVPVSTDAYPYDFRGIIQHEAGGHGFGKLADEYIYHNAYIQNCDCKDGCQHPQGDDDRYTSYGVYKSLGWFRNLSMTSDYTRVPWAHLLYNAQYSDYVDMYEGGYMHTRGIYRSEATSCMNNNIPYYSAISRQAIVERIKAIAGEEFTLADFYLHDSSDFGPKSAPALSPSKFSMTDPGFVRTSGHEMPILVGEHPNVK
ncbi:MAG: leucine-rich repeat protein [Bacteroidales bacterium]|nr:leucine-rich repeat protein [Bacteroidales bacterium]